MSDAVLAGMPTGGMAPVSPAEAKELLQLCTVMGWKPKLPLHVMRDDMAGRWFMRGEPGKQDYWIRDTDIQALRGTPMWSAVLSAVPYGYGGQPPVGLAKARKDARDQIEQIIIDDPVEHDRDELAKARLEAEERLRRMDDWE